jgi:hypothetical protein
MAQFMNAKDNTILHAATETRLSEQSMDGLRSAARLYAVIGDAREFLRRV